VNARAGALALGLIAGCASAAPIVVSLGEGAGWARPPVTAQPRPACRVAVAVEDERANTDTVGAAGHRPLHADGVREWVARRLRDVETSPDGRPADLVARVGIQRVYARTVATQMEGVVALRARFTAPGGGVTERSYRGAHTQVNWANGSAEFTTLLHEALAIAVAELARDAAQLCP
jgi:hypothetical protein